MKEFIKRNEEGTLCADHRAYKDFRHNLLHQAKDKKELEFIGQLVEDLYFYYEELLEEFEELEE